MTAPTLTSAPAAFERVRRALAGPGRPWILGGVTLLAGVAVFFLLGRVGLYNVPFILRELPHGVGPAETSLELTTASFAIGFFLGLPLAVVRAFGPGRFARSGSANPSRAARRIVGNGLVRAAYAFATGYVATVRGTPALVQVLLVYYIFLFAYPNLTLLGEPTAFWAGLVALTINTTGYQSEALRGGFQSVDRTQVDAARALGLWPVQIFRRITLPQGLRLVTLPLTNEWISNFKTCTVLSYIPIVEVFGWAHASVAPFRPVDAFVILTIFYLAINVTVSRVTTYIEKRRRIPGLGSMAPELPGRPAPRVEPGRPTP